MESTVLAKLQKLHTLVLRGEPGEAANAKVLLDKLCKKYDINFEDFFQEDEVKRYYFKAYGINQNLLVQIIKKVNKNLKAWLCKPAYHGYKGSIFTECTFAESVEIKEMYDHYKKLYAKQLKLFYTAFVHKNDLVVVVDEQEEKSSKDTRSGEELNQIINMMQGIERSSPKKKLN